LAASKGLACPKEPNLGLDHVCGVVFFAVLVAQQQAKPPQQSGVRDDNLTRFKFRYKARQL